MGASLGSDNSLQNVQRTRPKSRSRMDNLFACCVSLTLQIRRQLQVPHRPPLSPQSPRYQTHYRDIAKSRPPRRRQPPSYRLGKSTLSGSTRTARPVSSARAVPLPPRAQEQAGRAKARGRQGVPPRSPSPGAFQQRDRTLDDPQLAGRWIEWEHANAHSVSGLNPLSLVRLRAIYGSVWPMTSQKSSASCQV